MTETATAAATDAPIRLAFTRADAHTDARHILDNVAAVLDLLAAVFDETERTVQLSPTAARGLHTVLESARHDVLVAMEVGDSCRSG